MTSAQINEAYKALVPTVGVDAALVLVTAMIAADAQTRAAILHAETQIRVARISSGVAAS